MDFDDVEVNDNVSYTERPVHILGRETKKLPNNEIPLVKVQWNHYDAREALWELECEMHAKYPELFTTS